MNFDAITQIWNLQNQQVIQIRDHKRLLDEVLVAQRREVLRLFAENAGGVLLSLGLSAYMLHRALTSGSLRLAFSIGAVVLFAMAIFGTVITVRQRRRERRFGDSLASRLQCTFSQIDFSIWLQRDVMQYSLLPVFLVWAIGVIQKTLVIDPTPVWYAYLAGGTIGFAYMFRRARRGGRRLRRLEERRETVKGLLAEMEEVE